MTPSNPQNSVSILPSTQTSASPLKTIADKLRYGTKTSDDAEYFSSLADALTFTESQFNTIMGALRSPIPIPQSTQASNADGSLAAAIGNTSLGSGSVHNYFDQISVGYPPTLGAGFRLHSGNMQFSNDGVTWTSIGSGGGFWTQSGSYLYPTTSTWIVLSGLASTDLSLSGGDIVSGATINSVTAATNASVMGMSAVGGTSALYSSKTGSGTYQDMTLFTSATERMRITAGGYGLFGASSTDFSTSAGWFFVNNTILAISAASNANICIIQAISGGVFIATAHTGSASDCPITFQTANGSLSVFEIKTSGNVDVMNSSATASSAIEFVGNATFRKTFSGGLPVNAQASDDGSTWYSLIGATYWQLAGGLLSPANTSNNLLIGTATNNVELFASTGNITCTNGGSAQILIQAGSAVVECVIGSAIGKISTTVFEITDGTNHCEMVPSRFQCNGNNGITGETVTTSGGTRNLHGGIITV